MNGTIKTFVNEKKYGFIKGDDGKDYFFHLDSFDKNQKNNVIENKFVTFEPTATPKGYKAIKCHLVDNSKIETYEIPSAVQYSKHKDFKNYEILQHTDWKIVGSSRHSPDDAKNDLLNKAASLQANGLVYMEYFKSTGSEAGTGRGTHYYTIHHYSALPVLIGKLSMNGNKKQEQLGNLNEHINEVKNKYESSNSFTHVIFAIVMIVVGMTFLTLFSKSDTSGIAGFILFAIVFIIGLKVHNLFLTGEWLERIK